MQPSIKLKSISVEWNANLRPRVLDVVIFNGGYYGNKTGKNSTPGDEIDWIFLMSASLPGLFKNPSNTNLRALEIGDVINRVVEGIKFEGIYNGGDQELLSSYTIYTSIEF